jgi:hypothetical protein
MTTALRTACCYCLLLLLATSCVYEYPDDQTPPGPPDAVELTMTLELNIDFEIDAEHEQFVQTHNDLLAGGYAIRYIVDLHETPALDEAPLSQRVRRLITTETTMPAGGVYRFSETVTLPAAPSYTALVWVDFVPAGGGSSDYYYHTADLQAVTIDNSRPYRGYHVSKDAFTNAVSINLTAADTRSVSTTVKVKRPFALYRIVTTDVAEYRTAHSEPYADVRPDTTRLLYHDYFPMGYNAYRAVPGNFDDGVGVHYAYACGVPYPNGDKEEMELAADFVFTNGGATSRLVDFEVFTPDGTRISRHSGIRVNLQRNRMTVIRGKFLTSGVPGGGGAGIDFDFDDDEIVIWF